MSEDTLYFVGTPEDENYLRTFAGVVGTSAVKFRLSEPMTLAEVEVVCTKLGITKIVTTSPKLLALLAKIPNTRKQPAISNYAGSLFKRGEFEYLIHHPLKQLITVPYGKFLSKRYVSKFTDPESWLKLPEFSWTVINEHNQEQCWQELQSATLMAVDIETTKTNLAIRCIGYTAVWIANGEITCKSYVLPMDSIFNLYFMRKVNWLPIPKVLQNGMYDILYLARYNAPLHSYFWDTAGMMHSWYAELPKDLAALAGFFIRNSMYWKDMSETNDLYEYYKYNALDTYSTAMVMIVWMLQSPKWAKENYAMQFPLVYPMHLSELTGIKRDMNRLAVANAEVTQRVEDNLRRLRAYLGKPAFNTNSPTQVKNLLKVLGIKDAKSSDETELKKAAQLHPLNSLLLELILKIRKDRKLLSTYLTEGKELHGIILYSLRPWATDTGRGASQESSFWCGLQIQNIPRGDAVKKTLCAFQDFWIAENDLKQAESRDTAYIVGEELLIKNVTGSKDFHALNASCFFGVPYEAIYRDESYYDEEGNYFPAGTLDKPLRDLAKRVNHGANYNMGAGVLIDTMGTDKVLEAQRLLKLPALYSMSKVAESLLDAFHKTYPKIRSVYYEHVKYTVGMTHKLVGATGWTRYCFGNPKENKRDLNAYVAHCPQSLNAMKLNKAYMRVFYEVALPNPTTFRLCAQIHDSILYQFRTGYQHHAEEVRKCMEVELTIKALTGVTYVYTVPADIKAGKDGMGVKYWCDTE